MPADTRSPEEIERDIERERSELKGTLEDIQDRFSAERLVRELRANGREIGQAVTRSVKENPVALALAGVGIAWMVFGGGRSSGGNGLDDDRHMARTRFPSRAGTGQGFADEARGFAHGGTGRTGVDAVYREPAWAQPRDFRDFLDEHDDEGRSVGDRIADGASQTKSAVAGAAGSLSEAAADAAGSVGSAVSDATSSVRGAASSAAGAVRDGASEVRARAAAVRARIAHGTERLSEEARRRVIVARERALDARDRAVAAARRGGERAADFYEEQPLVVGALALAVGAAIGGALPRTRAEDNTLGAERDRLFGEAERIFEEERAKAEAVVDSAVTEAKEVAREKKDAVDAGAPEGKTAAEALADEAKAVGQRVVDAAKSEADKQDLGKPRT